jgi:hypothetical protein
LGRRCAIRCSAYFCVIWSRVARFYVSISFGLCGLFNPCIGILLGILLRFCDCVRKPVRLYRTAISVIKK